MSTTTTTKKTAEKTAAARPVVAPAAAEQAPDHTYLADKEPTAYHASMAAWMTKVTGVQVDAKQVQIVAALRDTFVNTDEHQAVLAAKRAAAAEKKAAEVEAKKAAARAKIEKLQALLDS
jgi:hypothetical protein